MLLLLPPPSPGIPCHCGPLGEGGHHRVRVGQMQTETTGVAAFSARDSLVSVFISC